MKCDVFYKVCFVKSVPGVVVGRLRLELHRYSGLPGMCLLTLTKKT